MRVIRCAFLVGCKRFFCIARCSRQRRLVPDSLIYPDLTTLPIGFRGRRFFCQDVTDSRTLLEVLTLFSLCAVTIPHHCRSESGKAWDR